MKSYEVRRGEVSGPKLSRDFRLSDLMCTRKENKKGIPRSSHREFEMTLNSSHLYLHICTCHIRDLVYHEILKDPGRTNNKSQKSVVDILCRAKTYTTLQWKNGSFRVHNTLVR